MEIGLACARLEAEGWDEDLVYDTFVSWRLDVIRKLPLHFKVKLAKAVSKEPFDGSARWCASDGALVEPSGRKAQGNFGELPSELVNSGFLIFHLAAGCGGGENFCEDGGEKDADRLSKGGAVKLAPREPLVVR